MNVASWVRSIVVASIAAAIVFWVGSVELSAVVFGVLVLCWARRIETEAIRSRAVQPIDPAALQQAGLGALPEEASDRDRYLDLVKRTVINLPYHESSGVLGYYDRETKRAARLHALHLPSRASGDDFSYNVLTMIGWNRLGNIQTCIEQILADEVPGDLVEAGAFKGGACIFMKAVLEANNGLPGAAPETPSRNVVACDTFKSARLPAYVLAYVVTQPILILVALLASIPGKAWRRGLFKIVTRSQQSFAPFRDAGDDIVELIVGIAQQAWLLRRLSAIPRTGSTTAHVRSHFARFGLLDKHVILLEGLFAETLPTAPIEHVALLRLDADSYESTTDALDALYPKLSPGGFCIVDDYHSFADCRRAVDAYRAEHHITEPLEQIDHHAVYWRRSSVDALSHGPPSSARQRTS